MTNRYEQIRVWAFPTGSLDYDHGNDMNNPAYHARMIKHFEESNKAFKKSSFSGTLRRLLTGAHF